MIVPAHAEKRIALVIGNAAYKNAATLQNPRNDATDVSEALKRLGFETIVGLDLDKAGMEEKSPALTRETWAERLAACSRRSQHSSNGHNVGGDRVIRDAFNGPPSVEATLSMPTCRH